MNAPYVTKLLTGKVKHMGDPNATDPMDRPWKSGIFKSAVDGKVWLGETGLDGDEIGDTKRHGGPEKALFAYPVKHYDYWKKDLAIETIGVGAMGENLAVINMDEHSVCIGDLCQFGEAVIEVTQPRQPCWKPARRFRVLDFALRIQRSGKTGWYYRVKKEGFVQGSSELKLLERPYPEWTIDQCNNVMHVHKDDLTLAKKLADCESLGRNWKRTLRKRLMGKQSSIEKRVFGPNKT